MVDERTKELYEKNKQIEVQNEQLNVALTDKDRVLSVVAHDLKNPMFAIVGALEGWLRREPEMGQGERRSIIVEVLKSSEVLQSEMIRLLEWARAKKEQIDYKPSNVDLSSLLSNVVSLLSSVILKKNIELKVVCDVEYCLWGDGRMMGTIFRNLVNNAVKFTHNGGRILVEAQEEEQFVVVKIADNGVGMTAEQLSKLKKDGFCVSSLGTDNEKGTGLGFRVCMDYIVKNKGSFDIESEKGVGTTIYIKLPKSSKKVEDMRRYLNVGENSSVEWTVDKEVLEGNVAVVVDDDPLICKNIADMLRPYMMVHLASNGQEALSVIEKNEVDLILSDMEMPVMNGLELSRKLSSDVKTSSIPFLFLSAKNEQSDRLLGLLSGAIDYISKPFSAGELLMKVNNVLRLRQKQQTRLLQQYYEEGKPTNVQNLEEKAPVSHENMAIVEEKLNPFVDNLMKFIEENYKNSELSIEEIANAMYVSQSTLSRRTKSLLGKSPVELVGEFRLNKAMQVFKNQEEELNVSEVAYSVGFSDPAYFSRKFKEFFGVLPSAVK
jgi:DNA-binding response OmpR family regulator/nitrogen-specific signal transduction histidine kinase